MIIEPAQNSDLSKIQTLLKNCELPFEDLTPGHLDHFFMLSDGDVVIGSIGLEIRENFGLLRSLAVAESQRGVGLGIQLTQQIEDYAQSQNIAALYLLTTTADHFFSKLGYQVVPRAAAPVPLQETTEFKSICPASAVCMLKTL